MAGKLPPVGFLYRRPHFYGHDGLWFGCYFLNMGMRKMSHCLATTCDELMKNEERLQPNDRRAARININGHPYQQCCSSNAHNAHNRSNCRHRRERSFSRYRPLFDGIKVHQMGPLFTTKL